MKQKELELKIRFPEEPDRSSLLDELGGEIRPEDLRELGDILEAATQSLKRRIQSESTLTIELSGQVRLEKTAKVGSNIVVFEVGGNLTGDRTTAMKVTLETKIKPDK
jgi:hypothetical protein